MDVCPKTKPIEPTLQIYERNRGVGIALKAFADGAAPEKGISRLHPQNVIWNKRARRYRFAAGCTGARGKAIGGRFTKAPDYAPPERKAGYCRKNNKKKL